MIRQACSLLLALTLLGCQSDSDDSQDDQSTNKPVAAFTLTVDQRTVNVDGSSSRSSGGRLSYLWDFNNEATRTGANASYQFASNGEKTITLTVTENGVKSTPVSKKVSVSAASSINNKPLASATVQVNGLTVSLDGGRSSDPDGDTLTYQWDLNGESTAIGQTAQHTFASAGSKTIRLVVNDGELDSDAFNIKVTLTDSPAPSNSAPVADFTFTVSDLAVSVDGSQSKDDDGDSLTYRWTFAGKETAESVSSTAQYTFDSAGDKTVTLIVNDGKIDSAPVTKTVTVAAPAVDYSAALSAVAAKVPENCLTCHGATPILGAKISYGTGSEADVKAGLTTYLGANPDSVQLVKDKPTGGTSHTGQKPFADEPIKSQWFELVDGIASELTATNGDDSATVAALIAEDYEDENVGSVPSGWSINRNYAQYSGADAQQHSDVIRVVDDVVHSGSKALHVSGHTSEKRYIFQDISLPEDDERLYVRFYVRSAQYLGNRADETMNHNHFLAISNGDIYNEQEVRIGEMKGALGVNESVSDALVPKYELWWGKVAGPRMEADTWYCVETAFLNTGAKSELRIWLDGKLITEVTEPTDFHSTVADKWLAGRFKRINLGWASWSTYANELYFDDFVAAKERIGCM